MNPPASSTRDVLARMLATVEEMQRALDEHLAGCRSCGAYRRTLEATVWLLEGLASARPAKASPETKRRILDTLP